MPLPYIHAHTVTTVPLKIVDSDSRRTSLVIFNTHAANTVYIKPSASITAANSFLIFPETAVEFKVPEDDPTSEMHALSSAAGSDVRVVEGFGKK